MFHVHIAIHNVSFWIYSRTSLFRTRLIRSPRYFEGRSNALGFTLLLYASPVISKPRYFELFFHFPWDFEIAGFDCTIKQQPTRVCFFSLTDCKTSVAKCLKTLASCLLTHDTRYFPVLAVFLAFISLRNSRVERVESGYFLSTHRAYFYPYPPSPLLKPISELPKANVVYLWTCQLNKVPKVCFKMKGPGNKVGP